MRMILGRAKKAGKNGLVLLGFLLWGGCVAAYPANPGHFNFSSPASRLILGDNGSTSSFKTMSEGRIIGWDQLSITKPGPASNVLASTWTLTLGRGAFLQDSSLLPTDLLYSATYGLVSHGVRISALEYDNNANKRDISTLYNKVADLGIAVVPPTISTDTYDLTGNYAVSPSNPVVVTTDTTISGNGNSVQFARKSLPTTRGKRRSGDGFIEVAAGKTLTFTDVVLKDYSDDLIVLHRGARVVFGNNTVIELADRVSMLRDWDTAGTVMINGVGNTLTMDGYRLNIASGMLILQNMSLAELEDGSIVCGDAGTRLALSNTNLQLSSDFNFMVGGIIVDDKVTIDGQSTFGYATNQPLRINSYGTLAINMGSSFFYQPTSNDRDLIRMADRTSTLQLNGCTLLSTTTGMRLTNGRLVVDSNNDIDNTGAKSLSEAIAFGNGTADNDLAVEVLPGASLHLLGGILDYGNAA